MSEIPKRLAPTPETFRELYLKSGNVCAFPGCTALMMDEEGTFIGQLCHIEAAEPGGERFNPAMTNEERRSAPNLMLMCYAHHRITNKVELYSAAVLREMKAAHERRYSGSNRAMHERLAKMKWGALVSAGVIAGASMSEIAHGVSSLMNALAGPGDKNGLQLRQKLLRQLRYAPSGTVYCYTRDAFHKAVADDLLAIFSDAGWKVVQLENPPQGSQDFDRSMVMMFVLPEKDQVSNARQTINDFFRLGGFSSSDARRDEMVRGEGDYRISFLVAVGSAK